MNNLDLKFEESRIVFFQGKIEFEKRNTRKDLNKTIKTCLTFKLWNQFSEH